MYKKYNSTFNQNNIINTPILNLKLSQKNTELFNPSERPSSKNLISKNELISTDDYLNKKDFNNINKIDKFSNSNLNLIRDDTSSLDNISRIIEPKNNILSNTQKFCEDNNSSLCDHNNLNHSITIPRLTAMVNPQLFTNNIKVYDSHTKSFQLKMKKMKEMNKIIIKKNKIMNDSYKSFTTYNSNRMSNLKLYNNGRHKIISMGSDNNNNSKLLENIGGLNSFNIHINDNSNNVIDDNININKNNKNSGDKGKLILCCMYKS